MNTFLLSFSPATVAILLLVTASLMLVIGFLLGRYYLWLAGGGAIVQAKLQPAKTVRMQDFKNGQIYGVMAARLQQAGFINLASQDIDKSLSKIAKAMKKSPAELQAVRLEGNNWKVSLKNFSNGKKEK